MRAKTGDVQDEHVAGGSCGDFDGGGNSLSLSNNSK